MEFMFVEMKGPANVQGEITMKWQKIHQPNFLKIFSSRTIRPILTKLGTKHSWVKGTYFFFHIKDH